MKNKYWQKIKESNLKSYYALLGQNNERVVKHVQQASSLESLTAKYGN